MRKLCDVQVVVLMGGLGTRLKEYTKTTPKPLVKVGDKPFFDYQLELLKGHGFRKFLFLIGYRAEMIEEYYGDGSDKGISITYCYDGEKLLGTGGAIRRAYDYLEEDFLLIYGDSFMDIDYEESVYRFYEGKKSGHRALMTVMRNHDRFDKSNVVLSGNEIVLYDKHNTTPEMDAIDYGVGMFEKSLFADFEEDTPFDVAVIQNRLSKEGRLTAHIVTKRFYEIGSPASLKEFSEYVIYRMEESHPAIFLDRDGVINEIVFNEDTELLDTAMNVSEFRMFDYVPETIKKLREKGYYVFIVTNQPSAAKGKTSLINLYDINTHFAELLNEAGTCADDIVMCPHYPKRLDRTTDDYLIGVCDCRKPKPGMIKKIMRKYNIDAEHSYMVGDSFTDVECGKAAGVKTVFVGDYKCDVCARLMYDKPNHVVKDLRGVLDIL